MSNAQTVHLGDLFRPRKEPGVQGLPVLSVTMNRGLVRRDSLDRKSDGKLAVEEHLLIRKGDVAYNMMRMWQGASGVAKCDGIVSPAYVVLEPKNDLDPTFAGYWFKSDRMIHRFWSYSYGLTNDRLRLYYKDFARIPVALPPKSTQRRVADLLGALDRTIHATTELLRLKSHQRTGLAEQLLTGRRRLLAGELASRGPAATKASEIGEIPADWDVVRFGSLGSTYPGLSGKSKSDFGRGAPYIPYLNVFDNTCIDPMRLDFVQVAKGERQNEVRYGDIFFTTSSETPLEVGMASVLLEEVSDTYLNSFCFGFRLHNFDRLIPDFAGYLLRGARVRREIARLAQGATRYNLPQAYVKDLRLALPSIPEQRRIVEVLRTADRAIALLRTKRNSLHLLKTALVRSLLDRL